MCKTTIDLSSGSHLNQSIENVALDTAIGGQLELLGGVNIPLHLAIDNDIRNTNLSFYPAFTNNSYHCIFIRVGNNVALNQALYMKVTVETDIPHNFVGFRSSLRKNEAELVVWTSQGPVVLWWRHLSDCTRKS